MTLKDNNTESIEVKAITHSKMRSYRVIGKKLKKKKLIFLYDLKKQFFHIF